MDMNHGAHFRLVFLGTVKIVVNWKKMLRGKAIHPFDRDTLSAPCFDHRTWGTSVIPPHPRDRKIAVRFHQDFSHFKAVMMWSTGCLRYHWDWERIDELLESFGIKGRTLGAACNC